MVFEILVLMIFFLSFHPNPIDISYPKPTKSWIFMVFISVLSSVGDNLERKIIFKIPFRKTHFFLSWILVLQTHSATQNSVSNRGGGYLEQKKIFPLNFSGEQFWQISLRGGHQKIRRIFGFFENSPIFHELDLRAQEELEARTTCVVKA